MKLTLQSFPMMVLLMISGRVRSETDESPCPMNDYEYVLGYVKDGNLITGEPELSYPSSQYRRIPDPESDSYYDFFFVLCPCAIKQCVRKCCKPGLVGILANGSFACSLPPNETMGKLENFTIPKYNNEKEMLEIYETDKFHVVYERPLCAWGITRLGPVRYYGVTDNGSLWNRENKSTPPGLFCLERFVDTNFQIEAVECLGKKNYTIYNKEENDGSEQYETWHDFVYELLLICSITCLLTTFLVYAIIKELRNMHGKSLMCHVASLSICDTCCWYIIFHEVTTAEKLEILLYVFLFFYIASHLWLSVMCFDLCCNLRRLRPTRRNSRYNETKTFITYATYSWGLPLFVLVFDVWFGNNFNIIFIFVTIIVFSNALMYLYAAMKTAKYKRETERILRGSESNTNIDYENQRYLLYLNLFLVMGAVLMVEWILICTLYYFNSKIFDFFISYSLPVSKGICNFLIFVCKKRVLKLLYKKFFPKH